MEFTALSAEEFRIFSDTYPGSHFYQTVDVAAFREAQGATAEFVGIKQGATIIAAVMLTSRRTQFGREFSAPGGFLVDYTNTALLTFFIKNIRTYLAKRNAFALHFAPRIYYRERDITGALVVNGFDNSPIIEGLVGLGCQRFAASTDLSAGRSTPWNFHLSLAGHSEESLLASFRQSTRQSIKKSIARGITVREIDENELVMFSRLIEASAKRNGILARQISYYKNALKHFNKSTRVRLLVAELERTPISAAMFVYHGTTVHYLFAGTPTEFLAHCPQFAIVWDSMKTALREGYELYDFGGISENVEYATALKGLYTFKRGFRGYVTEYIGDFTLVVSPARYRLYLRWKQLEGLTTNFAKRYYTKLS